ncbi:MAG: glycosyltransferase family 4 protein [Hungatella sp.]|nr:glycosyltransferase family 4 protein [Hungatella sp.]
MEEIMKNKKGIVFVTDKWGRFDDGGIDVFNQKLCEAMGYVMNRDEAVVVCLVIGTVEDQLIENAQNSNIIVISYNQGESETVYDICTRAVSKVVRFVPNTEFIWMGHDIIFGEYVCHMAKVRKEKSAVIFHTDYFRVHADRSDNVSRRETGNDNLGKRERQNDIAEKVDYVFCVGPIVYKRFRRLNKHNKEKVIQIIPGLEEKERVCDDKNRNILIAGRFFGNSEVQKNWEKTCQAVEFAMGELEGRGIRTADYITTVFGFDSKMSDEELQDLQDEVNKKLRNHNVRLTIQLKKYDNYRRYYLKELEGSAIFVMGSELESFGMTAWEALAFEVPIVISDSSGLYEYLEEHLGYLLRGLCGTFPACKGNNVEYMGKSIADILAKPEKMKKATELLREIMSINKWENLAIEIAKKVGIDDVMDEMTYKNHDCFEFTYVERGLMVSEIKARVKNKKVKKRMVFFGGISRKLFWRDEKLLEWDNQFASSLMQLLIDNHNVHIYLCYETDGAIEQRGKEMGEEMERKEEILLLKSKKIGLLNEIFEEKYGARFNGCKNRFHLVPLTKSPSVYINILDDDWYFSLKYENRTTQNATMKLRNGEEGKSEKDRLLAHMKFILSDNKEEMESKSLISELEKWRSEYSYG